MSTLYVSDLDSTLLRSDATLSTFTRDTINKLTEKGLMFSYATARSAVTASAVTKGLCGDIPIIVYTGAFIMENGTHKILLSNFMTDDEVQAVTDAVREFNLCPITYAYVGGKERFMYDPEVISESVREFIKTREGDSRSMAVTGGFEGTLRGDIFYFTFMEQKEKLRPVYDFLKLRCNCLFQPDNYTDNWFLEVMPIKATKANSALKLKEILGADKLIAFGDGYNDIKLFEVADEAYAVGNAVDELKTIATGVIGTCDEDGVAHWLLENFG
ncbi:MAG: HAD hydrolase family protein [Ruminococcus sp.]|nr:HAD hydrolase family protein [Ruminococcus sp.]